MNNRTWFSQYRWRPSLWQCAWIAAAFYVSLALPTSIVRGESPPEIRKLFDGQTLDGWKKVGGGATYQVEDGCIVGRVGPGPNTFLRTLEEFANFDLRVDVKLDIPGNSGIQFRSHQRDGNGRVYGYQAEVDPSPRAWSGGIYDEGRRGWLYPLSGHPEAQQAFRLDGWNAYRIRAEGPWLRTWVNGVACADLIDTVDPSGFLALQVHSGKMGQIRWRDIELTPLADTPWVAILPNWPNNRWETIGGGDWTWKDGVLIGRHRADDPRHGHLITTEQFADFAVRLKFKSLRGNSGLYFRVVPGGGAGVQGFQAEIDPRKDVGGLYETSGRGWVVQPTAEQVAKWFKPDAWNEMAVVALGDRVVVQVNGHTSAALQHDPGRRRGHIALQLHGGQDVEVMFRDVQWMDLSPWGDAAASSDDATPTAEGQ